MAASKEGIDRAKRVTGRTFPREKPAIGDRRLLDRNLFVVCDNDELLELWEALRVFYSNGYIPEDSPLEAYRQKYQSCNPIGLSLVVMEQDLLRAIAVRFAKILRG